MKIKQNRTVYEEVEITEDSVKQITINRIRRLLDGGEFLRKEKGKTYLKQDDPNWRHGSVSEEIVREATELDIAVFKVLKALDEPKS